MNDITPEQSAIAQTVAARELQRFRSIQQLHNHWERKIGPPAYYWYLTFDDCTDLHAMARRCRDAALLPYYDFTSPSGLHMTLDRIAFSSDVTPGFMQAITSAVAQACTDMPAFEITVGGLGGTPGALGFSAFPAEPLQRLRDLLRMATLSTYPNAPVKTTGFQPHVAIAYCNSDLPAMDVVAAVERLSGLDTATILIKHVALVLLEQQPRAYSWQEIERIRLTTRL
jgi:2'-5' RNA ligase